MYAKNKAQSDCDVKVAIDKGSIRLSFPKRHTPLWELMDGKSLKGKPKYLYLGKAGFSGDNPDDCKRAAQIAIAMESDLDHPEWDKLFDRTLEKYGLAGLLGGKYAKLADVLQMPGTVQAQPEITVGEMWEAYLEWKARRIQPTTFNRAFKSTYTNALKGLKWDKTSGIQTLDESKSLWDKPLSNELREYLLALTISANTKKGLIGALNEAFLWVQSLGKTKLTSNPFHELSKQAIPDTRKVYKSTVTVDGDVVEWWQVADSKREKELEDDRRAFTKIERDIIIKAFYESGKLNERQIAPLIEFLFLTGCRPGEAFALRWQDINFDKGIVWFSKSYNGREKNIQTTKTKEVRMFFLYPKLTELLNRIKPLKVDPKSLVFHRSNGTPFSTDDHGALWREKTSISKGKTYRYPGVVTRLVQDNKIETYLSPYHTRHTYITLTAIANSDNTSAILLLAHSCGNSVDVILAHYLDVNRDVKLMQV